MKDFIKSIIIVLGFLVLLSFVCKSDSKQIIPEKFMIGTEEITF